MTAKYILDVAYAITSTNGVGAYLVLVQGPRAGEAQLPNAANEGKILGVSVHSQSQGGDVAVRKAGIARVVAAGVVAVGDPVNIAGASGKVKTVNETAGTKIACLGFAETAAVADDHVIEVFIALHERTV